MSITADIFKGPLDPGGQPEIESPNKVLLGLFAWNVSCGATISKAVLADRERYRDYWQWPHASRLVQQAEQAGFDFEVPFGRYLGHGGEIGFNDEQLDVVASAAALSQITKNILLFSTVHVTYAFHPLHFARFGAQIDYLSNGRWGINIVTGWFAEEYAMFSGSLNWLPHDERYAMADEFVTLMKWLWASEEPIDFQGKYYRSLGGLVKVKPTRRPRPILVNAGHSEAGIDFAAKHCEWLFCTGPDLQTLAEIAVKAKQRAAGYGRRLRLLTSTYSIVGDTDAEAEALFKWIDSQIDEEATSRFVGRATQQPETSFQHGFKELLRQTALGLTGYWNVGNPDKQAETIRALFGVGYEGVLVTFFDPFRGVRCYGEKVIPRLKQMGLRA